MGVDLNDLKIDSRRRNSGSRRGWYIGAALIAAASVGGAALSGAFSGGRGTGTGVEVTLSAATVQSSKGPSPRSFTAGGWVEPAFPWPVGVSALTDGRVESLRVQEGDAVEEGAVVAELWSADLKDELRRVEGERDAASARLALLEAGTRREEIEEARARAAELEAERSLAGRVAERSRGLVESGAVSCEQAERDEAAFAAAGARLDAQKAVLEKLVAGPRTEEIAEARAETARLEAEVELARRRLGYASVCCPRAGRVFRLMVEQGERLTASKPFVLSIYDPSQLWVRVDVAQADVGKVTLGQSVEVRTEAEPDRAFPGKVVRLDPQADFAKNTITVRVALTQTDGRLHPDMTARVHFSADSREGGGPERARILIPRTAVVRQGGAAFVFEVSGGVARRKPIELGGTLGDSVEVLSGLEGGSMVVTGGIEKIADGTAVREKAAGD